MHIRNIGSKSIVMDLLCSSDTQSYFAVEMQKADDDDHIKRVRYNASNIDTRFAEQGIDYKELSDIYMIYITKNDFLHGNKTIYHVERRLAETGQLVYNGINEIYINAKIDDESEIAGYMNLVKSTGYHDKRFPHLSNRIHYFKHTNEGVRTMCDLVEEYAKKRADEVIKKSVTMLRKHGIKDTEIVNDIMENYQLTREAALSYM